MIFRLDLYTNCEYLTPRRVRHYVKGAITNPLFNSCQVIQIVVACKQLDFQCQFYVLEKCDNWSDKVS